MATTETPARTRPTAERPAPPRKPLRNGLIALAVVAVLWAVFTSGIAIDRLVGAPRALWRLATLMFTPPEWGYAGTATVAMIESVQMAWIGTLIAAVFSLPLGVLGAKNLSGTVGSNVIRQVLNGFRAFPELILAVILVAMIGLGALPGALAIGIHSIGTLGKLTSEVVEGIDRGPIEAAEATGGGRLQVIRWGVLPQVMADVVAFWLYRFEINIRASAILGLVGAGGIGATLQNALVYTEFEKAGMAIIVVVLGTVLVDAVSSRIRRRIIAGPTASRAEIRSLPEPTPEIV